MTTKTSALMFFFGLLLTLGAVGGMENPEQINYLWEQIACAAVGLGMMWVGTLGMNTADYYDRKN